MKYMIKLLIRLLMIVVLFAVIVTSIVFFNYGMDGIEVAIITLESQVGMLGLLIVSMLATLGAVKLVGKYSIKG